MSSLNVEKEKMTIKLAALSVVLIMGMIIPLCAQESGLPKQIIVLGETLTLKEEADHGAKGFLAEYIPATETWDNWTKMLAVRFIPGSELDPRASAKQTADNITALKETDPMANVNVYWNEEKKEAIVDFLISSQVPKFLEHNMFRFLKVPKGIVSYQIARRAYLTNQKKDEDKLFIQDVVILRDQIMGEINSPKLTIPYSAK
jgi:hypothetical protein